MMAMETDVPGELAKHGAGHWFGKLSRGMLAISVIAVAIVALVFAYYALPANDDFVRAIQPNRLGWWGYVFGFTYMKWQGRWCSCGLESAVLPRLDITQYYWTLIGAILLIEAISLFVTFRCLVREVSKRSTVAMTIVLMALLWTNIPSPSEAVYWFTGAVENAMVLSLAAMLLALLCSTNRNSIVVIVLLSILAFVVVGFHELYGTMLLIALVAGTGLAFWSRHSARVTWLVVTIGAAIGLVIVIAAPGNNVRFATDGGPHSRQLVFGFKIALSQLFFYPKWWLLDLKLLFATLWVACFGLSRKRMWLAAQSSAGHLIWIGPIVWIGMVLIGFGVPSWALGAAMPARTLSGNYLVFACGWLVNIFIWTSWIGGKMKACDGRLLKILSHTAEIGLAVSMLLVGTTIEARHSNWHTTGHFRDAIIDLRSNLTPWHDAVEDRYAVLRGSAGGNVAVPPLPSGTRLLPPGEIVTPGPAIFTQTIQWYFGVKSLRVVPPPTKDPAPRR